MNPVFLTRLVFDLIAAGLLLFGFAYWWLGNVPHEIAGTAMFVLLIVHNVFNRRWYREVGRTRREPRSLLNLVVTFVLAGAMLSLLVTSFLISNALSSVRPWEIFAARQIHSAAAYWALIIVAVHLGLRWPLLMGMARNLLRIRRPNFARRLALRGVALVIALHGVWSFTVLDLRSKLSMQMTLDWWNFEDGAAGFFLHCAAIAGLVIAMTYYTLLLVQFGRTTRERRQRGVRTEPVKASS